MSVTNGSAASATTFNNAFVSKSDDSTMVGVLTLNDSGSGGNIANAQSKLNSLQTEVDATEVSIAAAEANITANTTDITNLQTLSGLADGSTTLGTFTGDIIADSSSIKTALQALETQAASAANDAATGSNATLTAVATSVIRLTAAGTLVSIDMVPAGYSGQRFALINRTGVALNVNNETGGTAANRILTGTSSAVTLAINAALLFCYDATTARWQVIGGSGSGSSAPIILLAEWFEGANAPIKTTINEMQVYTFNAGEAQELFNEIRLPASYLAGMQVILRIAIYSADTSNTFLIQSISTLIRENTDVVSSTTNQRTSTNSAITASGANQNKTQVVDLDLTDATGLINSVAVDAGDTIRFKILRGTDTATGGVAFLSRQCEVEAQ